MQIRLRVCRHSRVVGHHYLSGTTTSGLTAQVEVISMNREAAVGETPIRFLLFQPRESKDELGKLFGHQARHREFKLAGLTFYVRFPKDANFGSVRGSKKLDRSPDVGWADEGGRCQAHLAPCVDQGHRTSTVDIHRQVGERAPLNVIDEGRFFGRPRLLSSLWRCLSSIMTVPSIVAVSITLVTSDTSAVLLTPWVLCSNVPAWHGMRRPRGRGLRRISRRPWRRSRWAVAQGRKGTFQFIHTALLCGHLLP